MLRTETTPLPLHILSYLWHWYPITFFGYLALYWIQFEYIFPMESDGRLVTAVASTLFFPFAVRVLGAWMVGPKIILSLIPTHYITHYWHYPNLDISEAKFWVPMVGACCATAAFELLKLAKLDIYPNEFEKPHWRMIMFAGLLASLINGIGQTLLYTIDSKEIAMENLNLVFRYLTGDLAGLLFSLLLVVALRFVYITFISNHNQAR